MPKTKQDKWREQDFFGGWFKDKYYEIVLVPEKAEEPEYPEMEEILVKRFLEIDPETIEDIKKIQFVNELFDNEKKIKYTLPEKIPWKLPICDFEPKDLVNSVNLDWLVKRLRKFFKKYVELPEEYQYSVLSLWVILSYIQDYLQIFPYLHFIGPRSSGKSRCHEILKAICFRAYETASPSEAAIARDIQNKKITLFVDEHEMRHLILKNIDGLLKSGYKKGVFYVRCEEKKEGWSNAYFDVSGLKSFTSRDKYDDPMDSRSIIIRMTATRKQFPMFIDEVEALVIRTALLQFRLQILIKIAKKMTVMTVNDTVLSKVDSITTTTTTRYKELLYPFLLLLSFDVITDTKDIYTFAKDMFSEFQADEQVSSEAMVAQACIDYFNESGDKFPSPSDISKKMPMRDPDGETNKDKYYAVGYVGRLLNRLGFKKGRKANKRYYMINMKTLEKLAERYNLILVPEEDNKIKEVNDVKNDQGT